MAPVYDPVLLARVAASIDQLSGGRFSLGMGVGGREDDYVAVGRDFHRRGASHDEALELMHQAWRGEPVAGSPHPVGPRPVNGERVPVMVGGTSDAAIRRAVTWGAGWTMGGGPPEMAQQFVPKIRSAWQRRRP